MDPAQSGTGAHGARKSAVSGNSARSLMLVLLTTSQFAWLPVTLAQPLPGGPDYTTNNQLLPPVAVDSTDDFVVVWESFGSAATETGTAPNKLAEPAVAIDSAGNLVVVWLGDGRCDAGSSTRWHVVARTMDRLARTSTQLQVSKLSVACF